MKKKWALFAIALCLFSGCNNGNPGNADMSASLDMSADLDMGGGGDTDMRVDPTGPRLEILAGRSGGQGQADQQGSLARFANPTSVTWDRAGNLYVTGVNFAGPIRKIAIANAAVTTLSPPINAYYKVASDGAGSLYLLIGTALQKLNLATGMLTTFVGSDVQGGTMDGTGTAARLGPASGLEWDGGANLYVADTNNHTIRQVVLATGAVTTLAGMAGMQGSVDGIGMAARFRSPTALTWDGAGSLYIVETNNCTIRKLVVATGEVTTFAGGPPGFLDGIGTAARFNGPREITWDGAANLYVADTFNNRIRKIVAATAEVTTLAGNTTLSDLDGIGTAATFSNPAGVTADGAGNLYVADTLNNTIRKIVIATAAVTTFAGKSRNSGVTNGIGDAARFGSPRNLAWDGAGSVYVAGATLRKVELATNQVTSFTGAPSSRGLAWDGAGNLYIANTTTHTIRKLDSANGMVTTVAGLAGTQGTTDGAGAVARFRVPAGLTWDGAGGLYIADSANHTIRKYVVATDTVSTIAGMAGTSGTADGIGTAARFTNPEDVVADGNGRLYVADSSRIIRRIDLASGAVTTIAGATGVAGSITDGIGTAARFIAPEVLTLDGAGNLYVADSSVIRKIVLLTAAVSTVVGVPGQQGVVPGPLPASLNAPGGLAVIPNQGLAITDTNEHVFMMARGL